MRDRDSGSCVPARDARAARRPFRTIVNRPEGEPRSMANSHSAETPLMTSTIGAAGERERIACAGASAMWHARSTIS
jgi:hypothetical protein